MQTSGTPQAEVASIEKGLRKYHIAALDDPRACPGQVLTITGTNFGLSGQVVFPGSDPVNAQTWTDTRIQVVVPPTAEPGKISLSIFELLLQRCGKDFSIYRQGDTAVEFAGGTPRSTACRSIASKGTRARIPGRS